MAERGLRELYDRGAGFIEELWSPAQQPLGLGESLCQLFFPLNKLGVALQETQKQFGTFILRGQQRLLAQTAL